MSLLGAEDGHVDSDGGVRGRLQALGIAHGKIERVVVGAEAARGRRHEPHLSASARGGARLDVDAGEQWLARELAQRAPHGQARDDEGEAGTPGALGSTPSSNR